jgi:predicted secreted protein
VTEEGRDNTGKASEILRRRGDRTSKLQKVLDRGSPRFQAEGTAGAEPVVPRSEPAQSPEEGRPAKPVRITVDLNASQHRFLREYCLDTGTKGTAVLRSLLAELAEDEELRQRLTHRLKR